jgi:hypothetical protein
MTAMRNKIIETLDRSGLQRLSGGHPLDASAESITVCCFRLEMGLHRSWRAFLEGTK